MLRAAVPEAPIHENRDFGPREDDIWADRPMICRRADWMVDSIAKAQGEQGRSKSPLGLGITPAIAFHRCAHRGARGLWWRRQALDALTLRMGASGAVHTWRTRT